MKFCRPVRLIVGFCVTLALTLGAVTEAPAEINNNFIGRLFLTPAERAQIEQARGQDNAADIAFGSTDPSEPARQADEAVALNGLVRRADGNDIVWVNGRMIGDRLGDDANITVRRSPDVNNEVVIESAGVPRPVRLKPGQAWDRNTDRVVDCYRCSDSDAASAPSQADASNSEE